IHLLALLLHRPLRPTLFPYTTLFRSDYLKERSALPKSKKLIFTGPIDEYFGFELGRLRYRGQRRVHEILPDVTTLQPCAQVNHRSEEHTSELQSRGHLVCRLLLEKKN